MIFITIEGADQYLAMEFSKDIEPKIIKALNIKENEINFICPESFFVHNGQEQTSFHALITIKLPTKFKDRQQELISIISKDIKSLSVHSHFLFIYFDEENEYDNIDNEYPLYLSEDNMVKVNDEEENKEDEEPYTGNIFEELDNFVASHPEMSKEEATEEFYKQKK